MLVILGVRLTALCDGDLVRVPCRRVGGAEKTFPSALHELDRETQGQMTGTLVQTFSKCRGVVDVASVLGWYTHASCILICWEFEISASYMKREY